MSVPPHCELKGTRGRKQRGDTNLDETGTEARNSVTKLKRALKASRSGTDVEKENPFSGL